MALGAACVGALAATGGLAASLTWDTPAGPSIVVVATVLFVLGLAVGAVVRGRAG
jgi:zinc transport system permease protein